jgi:hypothetical protein
MPDPHHLNAERLLHNNGGFSLKTLESQPPVFVVMKHDVEIARFYKLDEIVAFTAGWRAKNGALKEPARAERARSREHLIAKMAATIAAGMEGSVFQTSITDRAITRARSILEALKL